MLTLQGILGKSRISSMQQNSAIQIKALSVQGIHSKGRIFQMFQKEYPLKWRAGIMHVGGGAS
jgi:hypothetical protein